MGDEGVQGYFFGGEREGEVSVCFWGFLGFGFIRCDPKFRFVCVVHQVHEVWLGLGRVSVLFLELIEGDNVPDYARVFCLSDKCSQNYCKINWMKKKWIERITRSMKFVIRSQ